MNYRIFDLSIHSDLALPELPECPQQKPDITVQLCSGPGPDLSDFEWINDWKSKVSVVVMTCAKKGDDYLLSFPGAAQFFIQLAKRNVKVFLQQQSGDETAAQLLQDQVLPRILTHMGRLVMHSSAVVLDNGTAVAFLGDTGRGKSTLAASFLQAGYDLVTDDCLLVEKCETGLVGIPACNGLRLWPDSADELRMNIKQLTSRHKGSEKFRFALSIDDNKAAPVPLSACFLLENSVNSKKANDIRIEQRHGRSIIMAMVEASFVLDLVSPTAVQNNFSAVGNIARSGVPVFALDYPREFAELPRVRQAIEQLVRLG